MKNILSEYHFDSIKQFLRKMRTTSLMLILSISSLFATNVKSQITKVSFTVQNASILNIIEKIESQTDYLFVYNKNEIDLDRKVNISATNQSVAEILSDIFNNTNIVYAKEGTNIMLMQKSVSQQQKISGTVTDEKGNLLPGVTVLVKGSTTGTLTDASGKYTINNAPQNATLIFSFVGMTSQEIPSNGRLLIDVVLKEVNFGLEEVVVIGYGTQKKADITGAVSVVNVADLHKIMSSNASVAIQGMAAGVNVGQTNAAPGSGADIRIRGIGTFGNHQPLVIVDGVPSDINSINPSQIESINILKDASSAAIYGSRAANGVVIINTKRGITTSTGKTVVNYDFSISSDSRIKGAGLISNSADYVKVAKMASDNSGVSYPLFVTKYEANPSQFGNTDWDASLFRKVTNQKHDLSISRNGENYNFFIDAIYTGQNGIIIGTNDKQFAVRVNSDYKVTKWLKIGQSFGYTQSRGLFWSFKDWERGGGVGVEPLANMLTNTNPLQKIYDSSTPSGYASPLRNMGFRASENPVMDYEMNDRNYNNDVMLASAYLELEPVKGLKYIARLSQNYLRNVIFDYAPSYYTDELTYRKYSELYESYGYIIHNVMDHTLSYDLNINKHSFGALVGFSQESQKFHNFSGFGQDTPNNDIQTLGAAPLNKTSNGSGTENKLLSYFGRISYSYADKYLLQGNIRRDGSSRFPKDSRWGWFPSASVGWIVSKEEFFASLKPVINEFKIRSSYGELGNQEVGDYTYIPVIVTDNNNIDYPFGPGPDQSTSIGSRMVSYSSVGLTWEKTKIFDIGADIAFLENKLILELDYYNKDVMNILFAIPIPPSAGSLNSPPVNTASVNNKGVELHAGWRKHEGDFKYDLGLNISHNRNEVTKMGITGTESLLGGSVVAGLNPVTRSQIGTEVGEFYLFKTAGIFKSQAEIDAYKNAAGNLIMPTAVPGDLKIVDTNHDGVINDNDKVFMGSGMPKAELDLTFNSFYKNFDLSVVLYSALGVKKYNGFRWMTSMADEYHAFSKTLLDSWTPQNTNTDVPRLTNSASSYNIRESDRFLEDASYLRIKSIQLGYTIPAKVLNKIGISALRVYLGAENLLTLTKYTGWDPGIMGSGFADTGGASIGSTANETYVGPDFASGVDKNPYPVVRRIILGLQVSF
ncbi:MAG: TonB-dependent receptor [Bacteroidales bacterium]